MLRIKRIMKYLKKWEGFSCKPYQDAKGYSIGYGHYIPNSTFNSFVRIDENLAESILYSDVLKAWNSSLEIFEHANDINWLAEITTHMIFQIGDNGTRKFKKMIKAVELKDWYKAANEMRDSLWAQQTPERCWHVSYAMEKQNPCFIDKDVIII